MAARAQAIRHEGIPALTKRRAWKALEAHYKNLHEVHLRQLFAKDPKRGERLTAEAVGIFTGLLEESDLGRNPGSPDSPCGRIGPASPD